YRTAIRLRPDRAEAHTSLGTALQGQGQVGEAIAEYRTALRLQPDYAEAHFDLGTALQGQGQVGEAIAEYRTAIRLEPDLAEAHFNLGHVLKAQGKFEDALAELRSGHELGSKRPDWRYPSAEWVRQAERLVALNSRLPALLRGEDHAADVHDLMALAR